MSDDPEELARSSILLWLNKQYELKPDYSFLAPEFHIALEKELKECGYDTIEKTIGLVKIMAEDGQLHERNKAYQITNKGRNDLYTIYNDEWVVWQMDESRKKRSEMERKEKEQYELEERRHQEQVKAAREGNKLQKYGVWVAMALGGVGLLVAIFKP